MRGSMNRFLLFVLLVACADTRRASAAAVYTITDLGTPFPQGVSPWTTSSILEAEHRLPRIDASGNVSDHSKESIDSSGLPVIHTPNVPGRGELFPPLDGSRYRVGYVADVYPGSYWQALLWDGQTGRALGRTPPFPSLDGGPNPPDLGWYSIAYGVNDAGHAVGSGGGVATTWGLRPDGSDPLAAFRSQLGRFSEAYGINNRDEVVGVLGDYDHPRAFLFAGDAPRDLNDLIPVDSRWTLEAATGINDAGQIVGLGEDPAGDVHRFLLTPGSDPSATTVPEPSTLALLGIVTAACGLRCHVPGPGGRVGPLRTPGRGPTRGSD
jgi:probable HAF family extracellular repeat protein